VAAKQQEIVNTAAESQAVEARMGRSPRVVCIKMVVLIASDNNTRRPPKRFHWIEVREGEASAEPGITVDRWSGGNLVLALLAVPVQGALRVFLKLAAGVGWYCPLP
jgi:hypothetical protein